MKSPRMEISAKGKRIRMCSTLEVRQSKNFLLSKELGEKHKAYFDYCYHVSKGRVSNANLFLTGKTGILWVYLPTCVT